MALRPLEKKTGRKRETSEQEKTRLRQQKEKADWNHRNPDSKYKQ